MSQSIKSVLEIRPQLHYLLLFGVLIAIGFVNPVSALSEDELKTDHEEQQKLQRLEQKLSELKDLSQKFSLDHLSSMIFEFRITGKMLLDLEESNLHDMLVPYHAEYQGLLKNYKKLVKEYQKSSSDWSMQDRKLFDRLSKNENYYLATLTKLQKESNVELFIKNELKKLAEREQFRKILLDIYIKDFKGGFVSKSQDKMVDAAIATIIDKNYLHLLPYALEIKSQYAEPGQKYYLLKERDRLLQIIPKLTSPVKLPSESPSQPPSESPSQPPSESPSQPPSEPPSQPPSESKDKEPKDKESKDKEPKDKESPSESKDKESKDKEPKDES